MEEKKDAGREASNLAKAFKHSLLQLQHPLWTTRMETEMLLQLNIQQQFNKEADQLQFLLQLQLNNKKEGVIQLQLQLLLYRKVDRLFKQFHQQQQLLKADNLQLLNLKNKRELDHLGTLKLLLLLYNLRAKLSQVLLKEKVDTLATLFHQPLQLHSSLFLLPLLLQLPLLREEEATKTLHLQLFPLQLWNNSPNSSLMLIQGVKGRDSEIQKIKYLLLLLRPLKQPQQLSKLSLKQEITRKMFQILQLNP